jgi:hypothetical protein
LGPDAIFLPDEPYPFGPAHATEIADRLGGEWENRCHLVDGADYCWHGVRMIAGLAAYREWLAAHGLSAPHG